MIMVYKADFAALPNTTVLSAILIVGTGTYVL